MAAVVDIQIDRLRRRLADRNIALELDARARTWLANAGYDPVYGARPLKRAIRRALENALAERLLAGSIGDGDTVSVEVAGGELTVSRAVDRAA